MASRPGDFKSPASTSFATRATPVETVSQASPLGGFPAQITFNPIQAPSLAGPGLAGLLRKVMDMNNALLVVVALIAGSAHATAVAEEFNGRIAGTIDGRSFEVAVVCSDLPGDGWFKVVSDPNHMSSATDGNGDGVAIVVNGSIAAGMTHFSASLDDQKYNFGGKGAELTASGLRFESTIYRMDKETRKSVPVYEVELEIDCSGPPTGGASE
jgi:ribosomal protein L21E